MSETVLVSMRLEDVRSALGRARRGSIESALIEESKSILREAERIGKPALAAHAAASLARVLTSDGQIDAALAAIARGRQATAGCDVPAASVELDLREAEAHQQRALSDPVSDVSGRAWQRALACCRRALSIVEIERVGADAPYLQAGFMRGRTRLYEIGTMALLGLGDKAAAIQLLDSAKARGLAPRGSPSAHMAEALQAFRAAADPQPRMQAWRALMRRRTAPQTFSGVAIADAQAALDEDQAALWWGWLDDATLLIAAFDRDGWDAAAYPVSARLRLMMRSIAREVIEGIGGGSAMAAMERPSLRRLLLPSWVEAIVLRRRRIVLCPHRVLHGLPLQLIPTREGPLGLARGISFMPSLSALTTPIPVARSGLATVYATEFQDNRSLPETAEIATAASTQERERGGVTISINANLPARDLVLQMSDSGELRKMREVWFCCHGQNLLQSSPLESQLELGKEYLDGLDLATLDLAADIVVLLACHAGKRAVRALGMPSLPADDLLGLQGALRVAGARQLLAPQWPIEPRLLAAVLPRMHALRSEPRDIALQVALAEFVARGNSVEKLPARWAPLQLIVFGQPHP
ncbi:CHAT domain-containing protein [uncultured Bradyrhizobium sp.]|jgi:hypothetical protein|uniref:CHAT domain-containing protein n=1 Tax=uncultured Bradyrhizobium sp. TaxID=199684 RepID=UPI002636B029|nr:CHAT domain-containing protein [uncultured Bradyrhizobium sp.]